MNERVSYNNIVVWYAIALAILLVVLIVAVPSQLPSTSPTAVAEGEGFGGVLVVTSATWSISVFSVATWDVTVENRSRVSSFRDLHFKTRYFGQSGTELTTWGAGHTQYISLGRGKSASFTFSEFANSQTSRATIDVDDAKKGY